MSSRLFPFALASSLVLAACGEAPQHQMPPPSVGVVTIKETPVALTTELPGRTSPYAVSEIRPQISGIVKARLYVEGSTVKAGQALYQIDPAPYEAAYAAAAHAIVGFTTALARDVRDDGINVNGLQPGGWVATTLGRTLADDTFLLDPAILTPAAIALAIQPPHALSGTIVDAIAWNTDDGLGAGLG